MVSAIVRSSNKRGALRPLLRQTVPTRCSRPYSVPSSSRLRTHTAFGPVSSTRGSTRRTAASHTWTACRDATMPLNSPHPTAIMATLATQLRRPYHKICTIRASIWPQTRRVREARTAAHCSRTPLPSPALPLNRRWSRLKLTKTVLNSVLMTKIPELLFQSSVDLSKRICLPNSTGSRELSRSSLSKFLTPLSSRTTFT